ncbi:uncharacterized protein LOC111628841 [Centruroides sculpturatus]|uniref:uncharacterized protein LOC111628841 n=1 Tax=Centruroides sculpturatus TaxID=218467 RepID=UPI000C6E352A|nr:uncharacterized protein LOC111628841 [Centruroides sculpturatus]
MKTFTAVVVLSVLSFLHAQNENNYKRRARVFLEPLTTENTTEKFQPIISSNNETDIETSVSASNDTEGRSIDLDLFDFKGSSRQGRIINDRKKVKVSGFIPLVTLDDVDKSEETPQESIYDYPIYKPEKSALPPIINAHKQFISQGDSHPSDVQANFDNRKLSPIYPGTPGKYPSSSIDRPLYQEKVVDTHRPIYPHPQSHHFPDKEPKYIEHIHRPNINQLIPKRDQCICVPFYLCKNGFLQDFGRNKDLVDERSANVGAVYFDQKNHTQNSEDVAQERIVNDKTNATKHQTDLADYASDVMARFIGLPDDGCGYMRICCKIPPVISPVGSLPPLHPNPIHQVIPEIHHPHPNPVNQPLPPIVRPPLFPNPSIGLPKPKPVYPGEIGIHPGHFHKTCGVRNAVGIHGRVQNLQYYDDSAEFGEYPWHVAILKKTGPSESLYVCGGVLIHPQWIATAAHCLKKHGPDDIVIRLGEWDVHRGDEFYPYKEKYVADIIVHPHYFPGNFANDIALIKMDSPMDPKLPHITPACLPEPHELFVGQRCWVTGWGKSAFGHKGEYQSVLKEVDVPILSHKDCQHRLHQTRLGPYYRLHPSFVCAGGEPGKDACTGDGGSPMVCEVHGIWKVVGLVSWGIGCGIPGIPGVYVNMANLRPWIENIIHKIGSLSIIRFPNFPLIEVFGRKCQMKILFSSGRSLDMKYLTIFLAIGYAIAQDEQFGGSEGGTDGKLGGADYESAIPNPGLSTNPDPIPDQSADCLCVPYYQCKDGEIINDGSGIIDARKKPPLKEELPLDKHFEPPFCGAFHVCCKAPESSTARPYEHRCGVRNPSGINSRILSPGKKGESDFGEWPWQAAVLKVEGKVNLFQCGGVLIDKRHVLTVAHCVFHYKGLNQYPLKVRLGEWDTQNTDEFLAHDDYNVEKIITHPEFRNNSLWNDIAVLTLDRDVIFVPHIDTICLPNYKDIYEGQTCVVTGWGKDAYKGGTYSNILKEVNIPVLDNPKCQELLRETRLGIFYKLHEGFICAGGEKGLDSCKGDGGGPLVCYRPDGTYALAGLVSWGIDCGLAGVPGVYVRVLKYVDWIVQNTGGRLEDYWPIGS